MNFNFEGKFQPWKWSASKEAKNMDPFIQII